jgi:predicted transcriptional regulator
MNTPLETLIARAASWPKVAQEELIIVARQIELEHSGNIHRLSDSERAAINEGLAQADRGDFVSDEDMEAFFAS